MKRLVGPALAAAMAAYLVTAYSSVYGLRFVPRLALQPWLMNNGFVVYRDIVDQHEAGLPLLMSWLLPLVGDPIALTKWLFISLIAVSLILVYFAAARELGQTAGMLAAAFFTLWVPVLTAGMLWYEIVLAPLYLGAYLLWPADTRTPAWRVLGAGLALGLAVTVKQHAWPLVGAYGLWLLLLLAARRASLRALLPRAGLFALGVLGPFALYLGLVLAASPLGDYLQWAWLNNLSYRTLAAQAPDEIESQLSVLLAIPAVVLSVLAFARRRSAPAAGGGAPRPSGERERVRGPGPLRRTGPAGRVH
ncbi:MAG: hypothetical protein ACYC1C_16545 [Chloroflexota bacterium]